MQVNVIGRFLPALLICLSASNAVSRAQENAPVAAVGPPANVLSAYNRMMFRGVKAILLRSAEKMPEESYGFKPRSRSQLRSDRWTVA